jgi:hypothetical protein
MNSRHRVIIEEKLFLVCSTLSSSLFELPIISMSSSFIFSSSLRRLWSTVKREQFQPVPLAHSQGLITQTSSSQTE